VTKNECTTSLTRAEKDYSAGSPAESSGRRKGAASAQEGLLRPRELLRIEGHQTGPGHRNTQLWLHCDRAQAAEAAHRSHYLFGYAAESGFRAETGTHDVLQLMEQSCFRSAPTASGSQAPFSGSVSLFFPPAGGATQLTGVPFCGVTAFADHRSEHDLRSKGSTAAPCC
jgi:hypothetical protein